MAVEILQNLTSLSVLERVLINNYFAYIIVMNKDANLVLHVLYVYGCRFELDIISDLLFFLNMATKKCPHSALGYHVQPNTKQQYINDLNHHLLKQ